MRVDFRIDCCDGSDEYNGYITCKNTCASEHEEWLYDYKLVVPLEYEIMPEFRNSPKEQQYYISGLNKARRS